MPGSMAGNHSSIASKNLFVDLMTALPLSLSHLRFERDSYTSTTTDIRRQPDPYRQRLRNLPGSLGFLCLATSASRQCGAGHSKKYRRCRLRLLTRSGSASRPVWHVGQNHHWTPFESRRGSLAGRDAVDGRSAGAAQSALLYVRS
jgi:hypothetical protein